MEQPLVKVCASYPVTLFIAGDPQRIEELCKEFCDKVGFCVTVTPTSYVYRGGVEDGAIIGVINYPQYPLNPDELEAKALAIGLLIKERLLSVQSFTIQQPGQTRLYTWRWDHQ